jgi:uncharacterized protein (DUF302 family)
MQKLLAATVHQRGYCPRDRSREIAQASGSGGQRTVVDGGDKSSHGVDSSQQNWRWRGMISGSIGKAFDEGVPHRFALDTMDDAYRVIADGTARGKTGHRQRARNLLMSDTKTAGFIEHVSDLPFEATLECLVKTIEQAGLIVFSRIDHQAGAQRAGLEMPPTTVLIYGHPKGGTPIMLAAPWAALDLPLRVLVRVRDDNKTTIAFHPIGAVLRQAGVPEALAERLDGAQAILVKAVTP